ncbi:hypothetical protein LCGC14_0548170 [marine sediment metagenome]|uniref:Uncharacterized protein n=1 Tax=marine sediment metagenome TaxID=412755 RepID=A0A0F9UC56_9ZZZZ
MEINSNEVEEKVVKDMSDKYNEDISNIQEQIDVLKQQILINPDFIINLTERIQALYIKLHQKMKSSEVVIQNKLRKAIVKIKLFGHKKILDDSGSIVNQRLIYQSGFIKLKRMLEEREIYLNKVLERVGLTSKQKKEKKRIV